MGTSGFPFVRSLLLTARVPEKSEADKIARVMSATHATGVVLVALRPYRDDVGIGAGTVAAIRS